MSDITDWEPLMKPETNWEEQYARQLKITEKLFYEIENLKSQIADVDDLKKQVTDYEATREHQGELMIEAANNNRAAQSRVDSLTRDIKQLQDKFTCFQADAITTLKAIDLCLLATITTQSQVLTHRQRNFRMLHVHQIICNEVASLGDRKLITYEDDF